MGKKKNILCVTDKKGWCLYNIMNTLKGHISKYHIDVITLKDDFEPDGYDLVYYTHFALHKKRRCPKGIKKIVTITSHKLFTNLPKNLDLLKIFDRISVNSLLLKKSLDPHMSEIGHPLLDYTPSGVDTHHFRFKNKKRNNPLVLGWVGNTNRSVKNYNIFTEMQKKFPKGDVIFKEVATKKSDTYKDFLNADQMTEFYHQLDFLLITSTSEGTPNPGLEAMSCGVPVISTEVGNMIDIVVDKESGFFCISSKGEFVKCVRKRKNISEKDYWDMSNKVREIMIKKWDWSIIYKKYEDFFESVI